MTHRAMAIAFPNDIPPGWPHRNELEAGFDALVIFGERGQVRFEQACDFHEVIHAGAHNVLDGRPTLTKREVAKLANGRMISATAYRMTDGDVTASYKIPARVLANSLIDLPSMDAETECSSLGYTVVPVADQFTVKPLDEAIEQTGWPMFATLDEAVDYCRNYPFPC